MKYSKLFGKTVREAKKNMKLASHKLLYQAGFVRELSAGRYQFLPLGFRVWQKVLNIIDEELTKIGAQRFSIPILQPIEIWKKTNRDAAWGNLLMKIKDARGSEFALSATGEGVVTDLVTDSKPSYKDLPIILNQFIMKFRDELRARGGLLRTREFVMQDAYSYHTTEEDFMKTYNDFYDAYGKICDRFDLEYYAVIADSGALGGDYCHEFQVPTYAGEDKIVKCERCDYAANVEKAEFEREEINKDEKLKEFTWTKQPWKRARTIDDMAKFFKKPENNMIKSVLYKTLDGKRYVIGVVTGNLEVNDVKLAKAVGVDELEKASDDDLKSIGAEHGTLHAWGYEKHKKKITFVADESIAKGKNLCGGYKMKTKDPINVNYGRDFKADKVADIAEPYDGAKCSQCKEKLKLISTIEFGHVFKYDHFYTKKHGGYFTDKNGKKKLMYMGAYGIGLGRAIATIVEKHHDKQGIIWPMSVAPYQVHLISLEGNEVENKAKDLYKSIQKAGIEILWDERDEVSAGVKFNDADLIGVPIRLVISKRSLSRDGVEMKLRSEESEEIIELYKVIDVIKLKIEELTKTK
jgi:prolyl-tRNA synthetase